MAARHGRLMMHVMTHAHAHAHVHCRYDLKIIVLNREPINTVQSGFRRGFLNNKRCLKETIRGKRIQYKGECDALLYLAREAENQLTFFNSELESMSTQYVVFSVACLHALIDVDPQSQTLCLMHPHSNVHSHRKLAP